MADIIVDVSLPSPLTANVISPTQALATNISVPGPQGPAGPTGPSGVQGPSGLQGLIGPQGPTGNIDTGQLDLRYYSINNPSGFITGVDLSNYVTKTNGQFSDRPTLNGTGFLLSGEASSAIISNVVYTTGDQTISGIKTFDVAPILNGNPLITGVDLSAYLTSSDAANTYATINNLGITGSTLDSKINVLSGTYQNFVDNLDNTYATDIQLYNTGSTLDNKINSLSGYSASLANLALTGSNLYTLITNLSGNLDADFASQVEFNGLSGYVNSQDNNISANLQSTGSNLNNKINLLSGYVNSQDNIILTNLYNTGSTLDNKINNLSGYVNTQDNAISTNLGTTGSTLDNKINSLSGAAVLKFGDQIIYGNKTFNDAVYIHDLYVTGDKFIVNTTDTFVEAPYILLNVTGGAVDGGIFFVTGAGFTGINDLGPIIGFDHSKNFKFGISTRNSDLANLPDIASVQELRTYSGVALNTFSTIANLASTGSMLNTNINNLSGYVNIQDTAVSNNLISTGSTLDTKINSLSGVSVLTFGNQLINGTKTFTNTGAFNTLSVQNKKLTSYNYFTGNFTFNNYLNIVNSNITITGTLPGSIESGINYYIKNVNTGILLITGASNRLIDGFSFVNLYKNESLHLMGVNNVGYTGWITLSLGGGVS